MPYIDVKLSVKLDADQKQELVSEFGKIITIIPGKKESSLMIGVEDSFCIFKGGEKKDRAASIEVKILGDSDNEVKKEVNEAIFEMLLNKFGIENEGVYINYHDLHSWGANGRLL